MRLLERSFRLREAGSTPRRELGAGLTTFLTLSYILFVQPAILQAAGMPADGVLFATCVASAIACFLMAWLANYPFALAPAMGHNLFFAFTICSPLGMGMSWREALAANLIAGLVFLVLTLVGFREHLMRAIPEPLRYAIAAGIGMMIALIGFEWGGFVVDHPEALVQLGDLTQPCALLAVFGLALVCVLQVRGVRGAMLYGILACVLVGKLAGGLFGLEQELVPVREVVGAIPSPAETAFQLDFAGLFAQPWVQVLTAVGLLLLLDLFDTIGTLVGVADQGGFLKDGRLPRASRAMAADATGTIVGSLLGTSTVTTYVESASGISAGGRTGLTAAVVGVCFLASLFFAPLIQGVGAGVQVGEAVLHPVLAPVLILVGVLMVRAVRRIDWQDLSQAIPAFLTIAVMQLSMSITDGIAWGFLSWSLLGLARPRERRTAPLVHVFSVIFLIRYVLLG